MFLIQRKIVKARPATIGESYSVHARSLAHTLDADFKCSAQGVVTAHNIVIVHFVIWMSTWRGDRRHVDQCVTAFQSLFKGRIICQVSLNVGDISLVIIAFQFHAIDAYYTVAL